MQQSQYSDKMDDGLVAWRGWKRKNFQVRGMSYVRGTEVEEEGEDN